MRTADVGQAPPSDAGTDDPPKDFVRFAASVNVERMAHHGSHQILGGAPRVSREVGRRTGRSPAEHRPQ